MFYTPVGLGVFEELYHIMRSAYCGKRKLDEVSKLPDSRFARCLCQSLDARVSFRTVALVKEPDVMRAVSTARLASPTGFFYTREVERLDLCY